MFETSNEALLSTDCPFLVGQYPAFNAVEIGELLAVTWNVAPTSPRNRQSLGHYVIGHGAINESASGVGDEKRVNLADHRLELGN